METADEISGLAQRAVFPRSSTSPVHLRTRISGRQSATFWRVDSRLLLIEKSGTESNGSSVRSSGLGVAFIGVPEARCGLFDLLQQDDVVELRELCSRLLHN